MTKALYHMALALALVAAGCADDSYRGRERVYANYETPMAVKVAVGDPYVKGTGPVDSMFNFAGKHILVWAFNRDTVDVDYRTTPEEDNMICLLDSCRANLDGYNSIAEWVRFDRNGKQVDTAYYYPGGEFCNKRYDFYAFYPDDAQFLRERREKDALKLEYRIDGSQDLMVSKAQIPIDSKTGEPNNLAFSYLSVLHGDDPIFTMNHALVRMDLYIRAGVTGTEHTIRIQSSHLRSRTTAIVTPVAKDQRNMGASFAADDAYEFLPLTESGGFELNPITFKTITQDLSQPESERLAPQDMQDTVKFHRLGGSFFVSPEDAYKLQMDIRTIDIPGGDKPTYNPNDIKLKDPTATFLPGNRYVIFMTVYGQIDVSVHVEMVPWTFAGSFYLDKDIDFEIDIFTDADPLINDEGYLVMKEGEQFTLNPRNNAGVPMTYKSSAPDVAEVIDGVLVAKELPDGIAEAQARITITAPPTEKRPEGGYKVIKVKVQQNE